MSIVDLKAQDKISLITIMTVDEIWVRHYEFDFKIYRMQLKNPGSPTPVRRAYESA